MQYGKTQKLRRLETIRVQALNCTATLAVFPFEVITVKQCTKCKTVKDLTEFHKDKARADGYRCCCKSCRKQHSVKYRKQNKEKIQKCNRKYRATVKGREVHAASSRKYYKQNRVQIQERQREYAKTPKGREVFANYGKRYKLENPDKIKAQNDLNNAIRSGEIVRPKNCSECGKEGDTHKHFTIHGHHADYSKPLEVVWLCRPCHVDEHRKLKTA